MSDDVRDELEAIVRELAGLNPMQDIETAYVCFTCSYWERRAGDRGDDGDEPPTEHQARCVWRKAREAVDRLDAARQPVEAHIRVGGGHIPIAKALNRKARENPGFGRPNPPS